MISIEDIEAMKDEATIEDALTTASENLAYEFHAGAIRDLILIAMYAPAKLSVDVIAVIGDAAEKYWDKEHN